MVFVVKQAFAGAYILVKILSKTAVWNCINRQQNYSQFLVLFQ